MSTAHLAFFWHQHQPYYPDDVSGETLMPWVRLHATCDYLGMALHIKEVPEFRCTMNLVPSLLLQLNHYVNGRSDRHLDVSRTPADGLDGPDVAYLLDNFFMANQDTMIRPHARYQELYMQRAFGVDGAESAARRFGEKDVRDLQVWSNLTWIHELVFERDADLREFREKGRGWTEDEKQWLLDRQAELVAEVIPAHRELMEGGQLELTTTPFFHPILPLLWDKRAVHEAMPDCPLPQHLDPYPEDVKRQVEHGIAYHAEQFGAPPAGMWPSEGSVSQAILPTIADAGVQWIATDEQILAESTHGRVARDGQGHMRHPELLFRPWSLNAGEGRELNCIFRDHAMSDLVGFHYQRMEPSHAAMDLLGKVDGIRRATEAANRGRPAFVPVILDGENCWEYYPDGGVGFLRTLYREAARHKHIEPMTVSEHLERHPPVDRLDRLFAGSWINHDFYIWAGHGEDREGWDRLHETRVFLKKREASGEHSDADLKRAWEELDIAEGSDWFWWYGDDHNSGQDGLFDELFRRHLKNVYRVLGHDPPNTLDKPITAAEQAAIHTHPTGFLPVTADGRQTYFEWISAGKYVSGNERGTMTIVTQGLLREVLFGFDRHAGPDGEARGNFCLRVDTAGEAAADLAEADSLRVRFHEPFGTELRVTGFGGADGLKVKLLRDEKPVSKVKAEAAAGSIFELTCPLSDLGIKPHEPVHFYVEALERKNSLDRAPREGAIELVCPSADFEREMWQA